MRPSITISLSAAMRRFIDERVKSGEYTSTDDVVRAGIARLMSDDDFQPGEMERLIAQGEADIARGDVIDGEQVFDELRQMRKSRRSKAG
jgi:putative addiction module CopG family antidote